LGDLRPVGGSKHAFGSEVLKKLQGRGFAKILAPNWRVGYLVTPPDWVERLLDTKLLTTLTTPSLLERALAALPSGQVLTDPQRRRSRPWPGRIAGRGRLCRSARH
jgi:hypothetical protein